MTKNNLILYNEIKKDVQKWRKNNYDKNEIKEILDFQFLDDKKQRFKFLRKVQFEALETYLFLRFQKKNQKIIDLYKEYFPKKTELLKALGIDPINEEINSILIDGGGIDEIFDKIKNNNEFVKKYKLENLKETLSLKYPSFIFSLVMGAGKTILIGTIIYIEFALSLITKEDEFLKNALVFAPGKTIIGSLKEISFIDIDAVLPKRFANILKNNLKITYTQDNQKNVPIIEGSDYNIVITNIEKIRITSKKTNIDLFNYEKKRKQDEKENVANLRLKQLSSLKNLGIFSDEAHNTYGLKLDKGLKKVRQTIDHLAEKTNLKVVVNTTGTPYFKKQILKDVVFWYGLMEGIEENILKDVRGNIYSYAEVRDENFISEVLDDFFGEYKDIEIEGGHKSKIAIYFPKIEDVTKIKPFIEKKISKYSLDVNSIFEVNSKSSDSDKDIFINRINDKDLPYRIFLLVGMGKEGWNCPSLFSCCLARDLGNSNNFVLQASTRCLRQIVNNTKSARIYLSQKNTKILANQLRDNYGEDLHSIQRMDNKFVEKKITLIKYGDKLPVLKTKRKVKKYIQKKQAIKNIKIQKPTIEENKNSKLIKYDFSKITKGELTQKEILKIKDNHKQYLDIFQVTQKLVSLYSLDTFEIFEKLKNLFQDKISLLELEEIKKQIEKQIDNYKIEEKEIEELLTIIKKEGFDEEADKNGVKIYTTKILVDREKLETLLKDKNVNKNLDKNDLSFHYNPYKFDSKLEVDLFEFVLEQIQEKKENIKHFLFIGGITDTSKTDLVFEYRDKDGVLRNYTPDFLVIKNNEEFIFLETKGKHLEEGFKIKEKYFKSYLADKFKYKLFVSENENITTKDKQFIQNEVLK